MGINVELLRKIKKHILAEPKSFYMRDIIVTRSAVRDRLNYRTASEEIGRRAFPACGTAACFAGWACLLDSKNFNPIIGPKEAAQLLGLDREQAKRLFFETPPAFRALWRGDGTRKTARLAARRIDVFIQTDGKM